MRSIHVVFGTADAAAHAYNLAVRQPEALVREIETPSDIGILLSSPYQRGIAALHAGDEANARRRMAQLAAAAHSTLCDVTFEPAARRG